MKVQYVYRKDEPDPLTDTELVNITVDELISQLKLSRQLLAVAEADKKIFEEDQINQLKEEVKTREEYLERKRTSELCIRYSETNLNHVARWLEKIWVRYGRPRSEALPFRCLSMAQIRTALQRRINTKRRSADVVTHKKNMYKVEKVYRDEWRRHLKDTLNEKKNMSINIFRSNNISTTDFYLRTIVRQTRDVTMMISNNMAYFDALHDAVSKFERVKCYMDDDHIHFERNLTDLKQSIVEQEKQLRYLAGVFNESAKGALRAEKDCNETDFDIRKAEKEQQRMIKDLNVALEEHRWTCTTRLRELVDMNVEIKSCFDRLPVIRTFPFHESPVAELAKVPETTELVRTFELLQDLTQTRTASEVLNAFRQKMNRSLNLESQNRRLDYLLVTIIHPEEKMFEEEFDANCTQTIARREALDRSLKEMHNEFDKRVTAARHVITAQRDTADEFQFFLETLDSINERVKRVFCNDPKNIEEEWEDQSIPGLRGLLSLTRQNILKMAEDNLFSVLSQPWSHLKEHVYHRDFLEYRAGKLSKTNDRTRFDHPPRDSIRDEAKRRARLLPSTVNVNYLTNAQVKQANWQMMERSRLAELDRLKLAYQKDEDERQMIEKRRLREDAQAALADKAKGKGKRAGTVPKSLHTKKPATEKKGKK
ncbi:hypothetical protein BV898_11821 [Hypsibius exemplaris]|uniref:Uncharacterized protein n=1 Tax=Hypsibius exemplaris TaxID=2072580 RepID=A0A1W0WFH2_HYPEX|nr:hypothetical protein BV898_11821 [Hypsibius exemplaris]